MKIVHVASELFPYVKTGGLADAVASLASMQADMGHEVSVFLPGYRAAVEHPDAVGAKEKLKLRVEMGDVFMSAEVRMFSPKKNLTIWLVCRDEFFDRRNLYGTGARDFEDNHHRFILFCKGVVDTLRLTEAQADIVHCHDWQTGLLPLLLRHAEGRHGVTLAMKTVFTVHNIAFQGVFPMRSFYRTNLPGELMGIDGVEYYGQMSMMKAGLLFADRLTTVSPSYAEELQTPQFGCGLDGVIQTRADDLVGLLNGIDTEVWNPAKDKLIPARYTPANLKGKAACRAALLEAHGFDPKFKGPVFGMVCRVTEQKGIDFVLANDAFFKKHDVKLVVLGSGDGALMDRLKAMVKAMPERMALSTKLDEAMSHLVEAGSDFFLMPSRFEPCGLNQMYSQVYGTVPIVTRVGGLRDTVTDIGESPSAGTGIMVEPSAEGLLRGLLRAEELFEDEEAVSEVRLRGMKQDFSWRSTALAYERVYDNY